MPEFARLKPALAVALLGAVCLPFLADARPVADASRAATGASAPAARVVRVDDPLTIRPPKRPWVVSLRVGLTDGARAGVTGGAVRLERRAGRVVARAGARTVTVTASRPVHIHATISGTRVRVTVNRRALGTVRSTRSPAALVAAHAGRIATTDVLITELDDPVARLVQRLAALRAATPDGQQPLGQGEDGRLRFAGDWTQGFFSSALWHAYDLTASPILRDWARATTLDNLGDEDADTHDLGFMYERSSVTAWRHLCTAGRTDPACPALQASGLRAADTLVRLAATNDAAGIIPTRARTLCRGCASLDEADTIIDSLMNLPLLTWAAAFPGRAGYRDLAARHARRVADHLLAPDGSTRQAVHVRRRDGAVLGIHTHQGLHDTSTWSRGQAWAVYGFAQAARDARDPALLRAAERAAGYVGDRIPADGVPLWDYDAPASAARDVSAGAVTAAGLVRLDRACRELGGCEHEGRWLPLARRLHSGVLGHVRSAQGPSFGLLGEQVYTLGGRTRWDDDAELIWGVDYALEAAGALR